jgi:hypothetical protein
MITNIYLKSKIILVQMDELQKLGYFSKILRPLEYLSFKDLILDLNVSPELSKNSWKIHIKKD